MKHGKATWGFIVVGAVAALTLGAIGVAGAAGNDSTATPAPGASAQARQDDGSRGDGDGRHGGMFAQGGPGDLAEALADLSGKDETTIVQERAAGTSFAALAQSYGVGESDLIAEATKIETAELDAAVQAGQITAAQRTQYLAGLQERLETAAASTDAVPVGGPGDRDGDGGPCGPGGHGGGHLGDGDDGGSDGTAASPDTEPSSL